MTKAKRYGNDAGALYHLAQVALQSRRSAKLLIMVSMASPPSVQLPASGPWFSS